MKTVSTIDDEGFTTVSKIKYKPSSSTSKGKKNRKGKPTAQPLLEETDDTRFDAFAPVLEDRKKGMFEEGKWKADWDQLLITLQADSTFPDPSHITCFGLGPVSTSRIAQFQLLLMLDLARFFKITALEVFDPVFSELDKRILASYNITILSTNTHGHHPLPLSDKCSHLIYMPHCPRTLYQNFLYSNWSQDQLNRIVLLANEFDGYLVREPIKKLQAEVPCLPLIVPHLSTHCLPSNFTSNDVLNDLAFQWVPPASLKNISFEGDPPEGVVDKSTDEVI